MNISEKCLVKSYSVVWYQIACTFYSRAEVTFLWLSAVNIIHLYNGVVLLSFSFYKTQVGLGWFVVILWTQRTMWFNTFCRSDEDYWKPVRVNMIREATCWYICICFAFETYLQNGWRTLLELQKMIDILMNLSTWWNQHEEFKRKHDCQAIWPNCFDQNSKYTWI